MISSLYLRLCIKNIRLLSLGQPTEIYPTQNILLGFYFKKREKKQYFKQFFPFLQQSTERPVLMRTVCVLVIFVIG